MADREPPTVRVRLPHFAGGAMVVDGPAAEAFAEGARRGYPPVCLNSLQATLEFHTEAECIAHMARLARLPRRILPRVLKALPSWLPSLSDDADVRVFEGGHDTLHTAGHVRFRLSRDMARRAQGWLTAEEVAELLAGAVTGKAPAIRADIERAFDSGALPFWRHEAGGVSPIDAAAEADELMHALWADDACTTAQAVDAWLDTEQAKGRDLPRMPAGPWKRGKGRAADEVKRKVLKAELGSRWPTFDSDFDDAANNGLSAVRTQHGVYSRAGVLAWAEQHLKLEPESALSGLPARRHRPR
jgi:hypothetical protein